MSTKVAFSENKKVEIAGLLRLVNKHTQHSPPPNARE